MHLYARMYVFSFCPNLMKHLILIYTGCKEAAASRRLGQAYQVYGDPLIVEKVRSRKYLT
jgi:hypothetical protein